MAATAARGIDTASRNADTSYVAISLPIVGRAVERDVITAVYASVAAGQPQLLLITGEAGIGKTRLIEDLVQQVRSAGRAAQVRIGESAPLAGAPEPAPRRLSPLGGAFCVSTPMPTFSPTCANCCAAPDTTSRAAAVWPTLRSLFV